MSFMRNLEASKQEEKKSKKYENSYPHKTEVRLQMFVVHFLLTNYKPKYFSFIFLLKIAQCVIFLLGFFLITYTFHCTWVTSEAYSSPSIVLSARGGNGEKIIFDDFREAYYWLRYNTPEDAKIMSWWDYGYQITAMANRTVLVDNNTWNNTHISRVGQAMSSTEEDAYEIMRGMDVDYVLVVFGGLIGYSSDGMIFSVSIYVTKM